MSSYLHKVAGQVINIASLVSRRLAGRLAFRLFSSTRSPEPRTEKERKLLAFSQKSMREAETLMLPVKSGMVASHRFEPVGVASERTFLVVHGWGSRIDYVQGLIGGLRVTGARVIGIDLPGHGGSTGRVLTVPLAIEAIDAAWRQYGPFDAVIGHSFGGFTAALSAAGPADWARQNVPAKLVLIGSPVAAEHVVQHFTRLMGFSPRVVRALDEELERVTGRPLGFFRADTMLASKPGLSVLVLHAPDDKEVPYSAAMQYEAAGPHVRLQALDGLGHRRIVNSPQAIDAISKFLV
jgi:pimeloyl-ACP methyl ester carboxylesterase